MYRRRLFEMRMNLIRLSINTWCAMTYQSNVGACNRTLWPKVNRSVFVGWADVSFQGATMWALAVRGTPPSMEQVDPAPLFPFCPVDQKYEIYQVNSCQEPSKVQGHSACGFRSDWVRRTIGHDWSVKNERCTKRLPRSPGGGLGLQI